jgi:zinc/manganese transport system substrate-binding protein
MFTVRRSSLWLIISMSVLFLLGACGVSGGPGTPTTSTGINVVAVENFYGDIVKQVGGNHVSVTSTLRGKSLHD